MVRRHGLAPLSLVPHTLPHAPLLHPLRRQPLRQNAREPAHNPGHRAVLPLGRVDWREGGRNDFAGWELGEERVEGREDEAVDENEESEPDEEVE